jgi:hypothetical protein
MPSRVASRRQSAEPTLNSQQDESSRRDTEGINMVSAYPASEIGYASLLDGWEYNLENGGFMFDDDLSFSFPSYMFSSTN